MGSYFETEETDVIRMSTPPTSLRNDCSGGQGGFYAGPKRVGDILHCSILETRKYYGQLGKTSNTNWLQIWFVPEPGSSEGIILNKLQVTYIKKESLENYENNRDWVLREIYKGVYKNPAHPVYTAVFIQKNGLAPYYVLGWGTRKRTKEDNSLEDLQAFYQENHEKFVDSRESSPLFKRVQD